MHLILDPLQYEFVRNAIVVGILTGILCPIVGAYLVVQRIAFLGDVVAHAVIPGVALSFFWKIDILFGAFVSGLLSTAVISFLRDRARVKVDSAMMLTFSSFFALGILLISVLDTNIDLESLLFGDILGVVAGDIWRTAIVAAIAIAFVKIFYKPLLFYTFDPLGAKAMGIPVNALSFGLMAMLTLTIIASMQTVGVILVISLLIGPSVTAYLFVKELHWMMSLGSLLGATSVVAGIYLSYFWNWPSGPTIVLVSFCLFLAGVGVKKAKQLNH